MNYARLIMLPFGLILAYVAYFVFWEDQRQLSWYFIPIVVVIVIILVLSPLINWYFYKKWPQRLDERLRYLLEKYQAFYRGLSEGDKERFEHRLWLMMQHKQWTGMKLDKIPEDVKVMCLYSAVELTFDRDDFLFSNYNRIILYQHAFPSPRHDEWHSSEHHREDGVMIFSTQHLMLSFTEPLKYYDIALHEFAAIMLGDQKIDMGSGVNISWEALDEMAVYDKKTIEEWIGLPQNNMEPVMLHHYFRFGGSFRKLQPEIYQKIHEYLQT